MIDYAERKTNADKYKLRQQYFASEKIKIEQNVSYLSDEKSKIVYKNIINYRCTLNRSFLKGITDQRNNQYFDKIITFQPSELLYVRHYTFAWTDTILYAIDKNQFER